MSKLNDIYMKLIGEQTETDLMAPAEQQESTGFDVLVSEFGFKENAGSGAVFKYVDSQTDPDISANLQVYVDNGNYIATLSINYSDTPTFEVAGDSPFDAYRKLVDKVGLLSNLLNRIFNG